MSDELKRILQKNLQSLFENDDYGFDEMEVAFDKNKNDNLTDAEKAQFDDMEDADKKLKPNYKPGSVDVQPALNKVNKETGKDATDYYKDTAKKMKDYQKPNQEAVQSKIGEAFEPKKFDPDTDDIPMGEVEPTGTGMEGLRYDNDQTENYDEMEERMDDLNGGDAEGTTYGDMKKAGEAYKKYKYGNKYDEVEDEYQETPRVRTTTKENKVIMKYSDVIEENIFKTKGNIVSEEQVIKVANKIPSRIKIDETVFAITDGENYYRLIWEGSEEDGEAIITHQKNGNTVNESIDKMKHLWNFDASNNESTKKNVAEGNDDVFKKMLDKMRNSDGLTGKDSE